MVFEIKHNVDQFDEHHSEECQIEEAHSLLGGIAPCVEASSLLF